MAFVYESERHVFNIIKKTLKGKGFDINERELVELNEIIVEAWDLQNVSLKQDLSARKDIHLPVNMLTWWSFEDEFTSVKNYIEFVRLIVNQFHVLERAVSVDDVNKDNPYMNMIFKYNKIDINTFINSKIEGKTSDEFVENMGNLENKSGVYFLFDNNKELIYVGKSTNLGDRVVTSIGERNARYYEVATTDSQSDAGVYESYYISLLKPKLNVEGKYDDKLTINLECIRNNEIKDIL